MSSGVATLADNLRALLGADRVSDSVANRDLHGHGESYHPTALPDLVVWPTSSEEVARVVTVCARHGVPIVPFGAGTSLEGQVCAIEGGVSVDLSRMNRILRVSVEDMDVTVEAGVTRLQLEGVLRPQGVFFPVDPGADATIGGMVSTGASGTTTVRYGAMRENVVSLTVVTAAGEIVRTRSRARKSSAGYDLTRLFVGAEGTLGIVTEATLRLHPTPEAMSAAVSAFPSLSEAVECVVQTMQQGIPVARIELLDAVQLDAINRRYDLGYVAAPTLFLEFHGNRREVAEQAETVEEIARELGALTWTSTSDATERHRLWEARHHAHEATLALRPGARTVVTDVCVPISRLQQCIEETEVDLVESGLVAPLVGHVGDGNFHLALLVDPADPEEVGRAKDLAEKLARRAIALDGTCTGEHGVGYGKAKFLPLEHGEGGMRLMRAIKDAFDPDGLFNPGKIFAG
jgi:D-lactate dehydrogenase (cytochrome)